MKTNTLIYRRVSTDRQDTSLLMQEQHLTRYLAAHPEMLGDPQDANCSFGDEDVSGSMPFNERPGGSALLQRVSYGGIEHVLFYDIFRMGRNLLDFLITWQRFETAGVRLHLVSEGGRAYDMSNPDDKLFLCIKMMFSEDELQRIRKRTKHSLQTKFDGMKLTGSVPYGYDVEIRFADTDGIGGALVRNNHELRAHAQTTAAGRWKSAVKTLVANASEQHWIHVMKLRFDGGWTYKQIAAELNHMGVPPKEPAGVAVVRGKNRAQVGETDGQWKIGMVQSILGSKHTARILAEKSATLEN